jgi:hypothetical protein
VIRGPRRPANRPHRARTIDRTVPASPTEPGYEVIFDTVCGKVVIGLQVPAV